MIAQQPLVSIVVASYNHSEYLDQRIESLLAQDYQEIEIIVIDDSSTDESREVLKKYETTQNIQTVLLDKNIGWVKVSNMGANLAHGDFLVFANCDDYSEISQISKMIENMKSNPSAGLCFSKSNIVNEKSLRIGDDFELRGRKFKKLCKQNSLIKKKYMTQLLFHSIVIPNLSAAMFRKSAFFNVGCFSEDIKVAADWEIYFRIAQRFDVFYNREALNNFRSHETSIRNTTKIRDMQQDIATLIISMMKITVKSGFTRVKIRFRLAYLMILVLEKIEISQFRNVFYLLRFVAKKDWPSLAVIPFAVIARFLRIPVGLLLRLIRIARQ